VRGGEVEFYNIFINKQICVNKIVYICTMQNQLSIIKGIHPGFILDRELKERNLRKGPFAISLQEFPQTLVAITKGKRRMNINIELKIEKALGIEEGYFMILQVYHDIEEKRKSKKKEHPDFTKLRRVLFWDTKMENINWKKQRNAVIKRVFERGNDIEKNEIISFYGIENINDVLKTIG